MSLHDCHFTIVISQLSFHDYHSTQLPITGASPSTTCAFAAELGRIPPEVVSDIVLQIYHSRQKSGMRVMSQFVIDNSDVTPGG